MRSWQIRWGDRVWTDQDAVAGHLVAVADLLESGVGFDVTPWDGPKQLAAWVAVLLSASRVTADNVGDVDGLVAAALTEVYQSPPAMLLDALSPRWPAPEGDRVDVDEDEFQTIGV